MIEVRGAPAEDSEVHGVSSTHMGYDSVHCTHTGDWSLRYSRIPSEITCPHCRKAMGLDKQIPEGHAYFDMTVKALVEVRIQDILAAGSEAAINRAKELVDFESLLNSGEHVGEHVRYVKLDYTVPLTFILDPQEESDPQTQDIN